MTRFKDFYTRFEVSNPVKGKITGFSFRSIRDVFVDGLYFWMR